MDKQTHDIFPVRLKGNRRATIALPVDLTHDDAELIIKHIRFIAKCSIDHVAAADSAVQQSSKEQN